MISSFSRQTREIQTHDARQKDREILEEPIKQ